MVAGVRGVRVDLDAEVDRAVEAAVLDLELLVDGALGTGGLRRPESVSTRPSTWSSRSDRSMPASSAWMMARAGSLA